MISKRKEIPARSELVDYNYSVAGHAGTMCDVSGDLFVKPCTQVEVDFYQAATAKYPEFSEIMPLFIGTLSLGDRSETSSIEEGASIPVLKPNPGHPEVQGEVLEACKKEHNSVPRGAAAPPVVQDNVTWIPNKSNKIKTDQAVVLENASSGFSKPNILDAKLGVRLWADDAPLEKKVRFEKISAETTHGTRGFRIAGMRTYKGSTSKADLDQEDYKIYDKDYGRVSVNSDNVVDALRSFIFNSAAGITEDLGKAVARAFVHDLRKVEEVLTTHETRMFSSSLLFVFEGDGAKLREAIDGHNDVVEKAEAEAEAEADTTTETATKRVNGDSGRSPPNLRVDSGIELMDEDALHEQVYLDDSSDDEEISSLRKIFQLKLIDFAHATWTPGLGPDENTLTGVRSLIKIFEELSE